jgi:hypothetical protein
MTAVLFSVDLGKWGLAPAVLGQVPVPISEANRVTLGKTMETGTSLRSGASPHCLAQSENETALHPRSIDRPRPIARIGRSRRLVP